MRKLILIFLSLLTLVSCSQRRGVVTVKVIATSDVHGRFFETDFLDGSERKGSLAKFASFLEEERRENRNVVYVDCGDILVGSVESYQDITAEYEKSSLAAQAYNSLDCDAVAFGNHDMAVGANVYERFYRAAKFPIVAGNVYFTEYDDYMPPYCIVERHGVRIALLGLTSQIVNWTIPEDVRGDLSAHDIVAAARYWVNELKDKSDVIVALVHSGYEDGRTDFLENRARELGMQVPGIDVILYGHDHVCGNRKIETADGDSVLLLNPGPYALNAAVATVTVDFSDRDNPKVSTKGELVDLTGKKASGTFRSKLADRYADVSRYSDSIIGRADVPFESTQALWRPASALNFIHSIQMGFFGAQVSLTTPAATCDVIQTDPFRMKDAFSLYPFDNSMVAVIMKGREIRAVLERSASLFYNTVGQGTEHLLKMKTAKDGCNVPENRVSRFVTACGLEYTIDVTRPEGNRVTILSMQDGTPFSEEANYRTTVSSFLFSASDSPLFDSTGISRTDLSQRFCSSSMSDIRFYVITDFTLHNEDGATLTVPRYSNWKLVPEKAVDKYLASDTLNFRFYE